MHSTNRKRKRGAQSEAHTIGGTQSEAFTYRGIADRVREQSALAVSQQSIDHALDVVRLAAVGYRHTPECNAAVEVLISQNHWTLDYAKEQGYL